MNGITLITSGPISDAGKAKLKKMAKKREEHLKQMVEDYKSGKYDHIIKELKSNESGS
jgi:hypothetical protein